MNRINDYCKVQKAVGSCAVNSMNEDSGIPRITTVFDASTELPASQLYGDVIRRTIKRILPADIFSYLNSSKGNQQHCLARLRELLPLITWSEFEAVPFNLSFYLLCNYRENAYRFFFELISRWLVPGKRLNVALFFAVDFRFPDLSDEVYTIAEVMVTIDNQKDVETIKGHLSLIGTEIKLGVSSFYHAARILEIKGLSSDQKIAMIQENVSLVLRRLASVFDEDIYNEMQHFLVNSSDKFKTVHEYQHMSRIICFHYLFRRSLREKVAACPEKRYISVKFIKTRLHLPSGLRKVLGVLVVVNLLGDHEFFEQKQLLRAIQTVIPSVKDVEDSYLANVSRSDSIRTLYMEVEKIDGTDFSLNDTKRLRRELPGELRGRIERRLHPIFMPRNEEEIMRNIVTLSNQLKYVRDIPQVIISFDEQTDTKVAFTVILLRLLKPGMRTIQEEFREADTFLTYLPDRNKIVGSLRKKYAKEATVFRLGLDQHQFMREDHSVDLYKARQAVVSELARILGEVRDYNGGMISKQNELFSALKELLGGVAKYNQLLLENFFYSLTPVVMRSVLEPLPLKILFLLLLDALEDGFIEHANYSIKFQQECDTLFMILTANDPSFKEFLMLSLDHVNPGQLEFASINVTVNELHCMGLLFRHPDKERRLRFYTAVEQAMRSWEQR